MKYHNHKSQINLWHREDEKLVHMQRHTHKSKNTIYTKEIALALPHSRLATSLINNSLVFSVIFRK